MGEALLQRLKADPGVAAIAGSRIFWDVRPQSGSGSELPAVVLATIDGERDQDLDGFTGIGRAIVQASCFAAGEQGKGQSKALAEAVIAAIAPEATVGDISFEPGSVTEPRDLGNQEETRFVYAAVPDLTIRWGRVPS